MEQLKSEIEAIREHLARVDPDARPFSPHKRELRERLHRLESDYGILYGQLAVQEGNS